MKRLFLLLVVTVSAFAQQNGTPVEVVAFPSSNVATRLFHDGSNNLIYLCLTTPSGPWANGSVPATFSWTFTGSTLTSIVVSTNVATATTSTAHGLAIGNQVVVAGSGTSAVNGTFVIASVPSSTTFTYADTVADGTYTTGITLTTAAPRSTAGIWSVWQGVYSGNTLASFGWASGSSRSYVNICDNRATLDYR